MMITDVLRKADTDHVIYFLLRSYINNVQYREHAKKLPAKVAALPLVSKADVRSRFEVLVLELDAASRRLDDRACVNIKEALVVFGIALHRLQSLGDSKYWPLELEGKAGSRRVQASIVAAQQRQSPREYVMPASELAEDFLPTPSNG